MATNDHKGASAARRAANRARGESRPHGRVRARPVYVGQRLKITRRCLERRLFMCTGDRPQEIREFYGYTLGLSLARYGVLLHACCQMGNHHHLDITDVYGRRVEFKTSLHANLARGFNVLRGRFENVWSPGGSVDTCQPTDEQTLDDLAYTDVNPVSAGLVKWGHQWPGFSTYGWRFGETRSFPMPSWYCDPQNPDNPPSIRITRSRPAIFAELSDDELFERLMERCRALEVKKHAEMRRKGRRFKGVSKLRRERWDRAPSTYDVRFVVAPKVFASSRWSRLAQLQRNREWERQYAEAREAKRAGGDPLFPHGTYWLRLHAGARVANAPPAG